MATKKGKMTLPAGQLWTEPVLQPRNPKPGDIKRHWKVRFEFYNEATQKWVPKEFKNGINYHHVFADRLASAKALCKVLRFKLNVQGWNPLDDTYKPPPKKENDVDEQLRKLKESTFSEALDFAMSKKNDDWARKSRQGFASVVKFIKQAAEKINLADKKICDFEVPHFRLILDEAKAIRKLSNKGYNKYRLFLHGLVEELVPWNIVKLNYVHHVKTKQTIKLIAHRPPTRDEQDLIIGRIKNVNRPYYRFLCIEYACSLRPKEICGLRIKDLHRKQQIFRIVPDKEAENSKVKIERETTIPDWLMDLLSEMNLHTYDPNWYIFGNNGKYGVSFTPGPKRMHANNPTATWFKIVKAPVADGGLALEINQYSLKKLGGDDMVKIQRMEGVDKLLDLPQMQMGHTKPGQTEDYVTQHLEIQKEIIRKFMRVL